MHAIIQLALFLLLVLGSALVLALVWQADHQTGAPAHPASATAAAGGIPEIDDPQAWRRAA